MKKFFLYFSLFIVLISASIYLYLKYRKLDDFEPQLKAKLREIVSKGTHGLYLLDVAKINADIVNSRLTLTGIRLHYDTTVYKQLLQRKNAPADVFVIHLNSLALDGITPDDIFKKRDIRLNIIYADHPQVSIFHHPEAMTHAKKDTSGIYQAIKSQIGSFFLKKLELRNMNFDYYNAKSKAQTSFKDLHMTLDDLEISSRTEFDRSRFLYSKRSRISLNSFTHKTSDSIYNFRLKGILIDAPQNTVSIQNLRLQPRVGKTGFRKVMKIRKDRYDLEARGVVLQNIDWWSFITQEGIFIHKASIASGWVDVYSDKAIPAGTRKKLGTFPHQQLFKVKTPLFINKILFLNMDIRYSEFSVKTEKEGHIIFGNTHATVSNVTNIADSIRKNGELSIDARSQFMNHAALNAGFRFNLRRYREGIFSVYARMNSLDGRTLNDATIPLGSVKIEKASVRNLRINLSGDNYRARGNIFLTYNDLKITVLKPDEEGKMKKRGIASFVANNFKINRNYPEKGHTAQPFSSSYQRPLNKSFFSLIWRTIFGGVKQSVGI